VALPALRARGRRKAVAFIAGRRVCHDLTAMDAGAPPRRDRAANRSSGPCGIRSWKRAPTGSWPPTGQWRARPQSRTRSQRPAMNGEVPVTAILTITTQHPPGTLTNPRRDLLACVFARIATGRCPQWFVCASSLSRIAADARQKRRDTDRQPVVKEQLQSERWLRAPHLPSTEGSRSSTSQSPVA